MPWKVVNICKINVVWIGGFGFSGVGVCWITSVVCVQLFETLWTIALQAVLSMGILQAGILEWVVMPFSRGSSQSREEPDTLNLCLLRLLALQVDSSLVSHQEALVFQGKTRRIYCCSFSRKHSAETEGPGRRGPRAEGRGGEKGNPS